MKFNKRIFKNQEFEKEKDLIINPLKKMIKASPNVRKKNVLTMVV